MRTKKCLSFLIVMVMIFSLTSVVYANANTELEGFVTRLYKLTLNRDADAGGLSYWVNELNKGNKTGADVSLNFIFSNEFINKNLNTADFLKIMYQGFFNREPDSGGVQYWTNKINNGYNRKYVLANFVNSKEFLEICSVYGINAGSIKLSEADKIPAPKQPNSRLNPAKLGDVVTIKIDNWLNGKSTIELTLLETISGNEAWQIVSNANMFNDPPETGAEYILAKYRIKVISTDKEPFDINHARFDVVSGNGVLYNWGFMSIAGLSPDLSTELYAGAEHTGWTYFMVKTDDSNPVAVYEDAVWYKLRP